MEEISLKMLSGYWSEPVVAVNLSIALHLLGALILGMIVGYERSYHGRAAGMRTYGLVCMASAALTVICGFPSFWFGGHAPTIITDDPTRTIQGIVTGIGFLGAGVIMKDGMSISGLTTAASIWASSAIGVLIGVGFFSAAVFLTLLSAIFMMWGGKVEMLLPKRHAITVIMLFKSGYIVPEATLFKIATDRGFEVAKGTVAAVWRNGQQEWQFVAVSQGRNKCASVTSLANDLPGIEGLESYRLSHARN